MSHHSWKSGNGLLFGFQFLFLLLLLQKQNVMAESDSNQQDIYPFSHLSPAHHPFAKMNASQLIQLSPFFQVQSVLGDGIGEGESMHRLSKSPAFHIVISMLAQPASKKNAFLFLNKKNNGMDDETTTLPLPGQVLHIQATRSLPCIIERGSGQFEDCSLNPFRPLQVTTNLAGRVSLSLPIEALSDLEEGLPPLLIRSPLWMSPNEWVVAHVDADFLHKLSKVQSAQLVEWAPDLPKKEASLLASSINQLMSLANGGAYPAYDSMASLQKEKRSSMSHQQKTLQPRLVYDSQKNRLQTYPITLKTGHTLPALDRVLKRQLVFSSFHLKKRQRLSKRDAEMLQNAVDASQKKTGWGEPHGSRLSLLGEASATHVLAWSQHNVSSSLILFSRQTDQAAEPWRHRVIRHVEDAWHAVVSLFRKIGVGVRFMYHAFIDLFHWESITHTVSFLSLFYRKLAPLSLYGMEIVRDKYLGLYKNVTRKTDQFFEDSLKKFGVQNLTYSESKQFLGMKKGQLDQKLQDSAKKSKVLDADAKTLYLHDRILNNLPSASIAAQNKSLIERLGRVLRFGASSLHDAINLDDLKKLAPEKLNFEHGTPLRKMKLAQLIQLARSMTRGSEQFFGHVYAALMEFVPLYWNLAEQFMVMPLKIPFLYKLWDKKFEGRSILSFLDILCLLGGIYGNWQYSIYNKGKGPFTRVDIEVLASAPNPELLLYTWNHDPRTQAMDNEALRNHRLGIYDWMQKCHVVIVWSLMNLLYDVTLIMEKDSSLGTPGPLTYIPQVVNSVFEMIAPIAQYPFTQLETNDPQVMRQSLENPDGRYLGSWYTWVLELSIKAIRPFLGINSVWNRAPLKPFVDFVLVCGPASLFLVEIQIDMGKDVAPTDYPRKAVVAIGWYEILAMYFDGLLPFVPDSVFGGPVLGNEIKKWLLVAKHVTVNTANFIRNNILIGYNVVGMLSSSFQPVDAKKTEL